MSGLQPTGVDMLTGAPVWRQFMSFEEWVNKASSWMRDGDVCIDAAGTVLRTGRDFRSAAYPVTICRPSKDGDA